VVVEVLPAKPEFREQTYPIVHRLRDFDLRRGALVGSEWCEGDAGDFLQLTPEHSALVSIRVDLSERLLRLRWAQDWKQADVAGRLRASRATVSKMENADMSVSLDALLRALLTLGLSQRQVGFAIAGPLRRPVLSPIRLQRATNGSADYG
jgi:predicted XRE-type DNA-binding protein